MKILMLTHRVPYPPDRGDRIRSYHLLKYLAARAEVWLASTTVEQVADDTKQVLGQLCERFQVGELSRLGRATRAARSLATGQSATEGYFWSPQLAKTVKAWAAAEEFDAVFCYCSGMFRYAQLPELAEARLIVDLVDVDSRKWSDCAAHAAPPKRWLHQLESRRVAQLERRIADQADAVLVISDEEREIFETIAPGAPVTVVGNGVDLDYFQPSPNITPEPHTCCFVGVLDYAPNVDCLEWFCANVWPAVRKAVPDAKFLIVGKSPAPSIRRLAALPGLELHANVPDVRPYLCRSAVVVAPLRFARGVQNKVLEAMAMGKAVVATPQSLEGLQTSIGDALVAGHHAFDWCERLLSLFSDPERVIRIGEAAREFVEQKRVWDNCLHVLEDSIILHGSRKLASTCRTNAVRLPTQMRSADVVSQSI
jgi:polysaccharide biosynthesis protein PslH